MFELPNVFVSLCLNWWLDILTLKNINIHSTQLANMCSFHSLCEVTPSSNKQWPDKTYEIEKQLSTKSYTKDWTIESYEPTKKLGTLGCFWRVNNFTAASALWWAIPSDMILNISGWLYLVEGNAI